MIITNATLREREGFWDVHIGDASFGPIVASPAPSDRVDGGSTGGVLDAGGRLVVEPFVDAHVHLDYAFTAGASYLGKLMPKLVAADLNFAICPTENLQLQGWGMVPMPRGVAPIKRLTEAGLNIAFGQDSIADPFYSVGEGNMLRVLDVGLHVAHMLSGEHLAKALQFVTDHGAKNLGICDRYGIEEGKPAN